MFSWWFFLLLEYIFQQKVICTLFPQFINYLSTEYQRMMEFCWTFLVSFLFILENNLNTLTSPLSLLYHLVFIFLFLYALSIPFNHFGIFLVSFHWHFCAWLAVLFISCICYHLIEFTYIFSLNTFARIFVCLSCHFPPVPPSFLIARSPSFVFLVAFLFVRVVQWFKKQIYCRDITMRNAKYPQMWGFSCTLTK